MKMIRMAVVVAAAPGADHATISEVVLVPGPTALLAPSWPAGRRAMRVRKCPAKAPN